MRMFAGKIRTRGVAKRELLLFRVWQYFNNWVGNGFYDCLILLLQIELNISI